VSGGGVQAPGTGNGRGSAPHLAPLLQAQVPPPLLTLPYHRPSQKSSLGTSFHEIDHRLVLKPRNAEPKGGGVVASKEYLDMQRSTPLMSEPLLSLPHVHISDNIVYAVNVLIW